MTMRGHDRLQGQIVSIQFWPDSDSPIDKFFDIIQISSSLIIKVYM